MNSKFKQIIEGIREIYGEGFLPLHAPVFSGNEKKYLTECIDSTFVSSVGKFVNDFETKTASYTGSDHAIVCVNGTNALQICLLLAEVEPGDEVITQSLTFIATANAISYANALPVFIDVDIDTMGLSPKALLEFLNSETKIGVDGFTYNKSTGRRIKACLPMHTFGHACRIDEIIDICKSHNIEVIEDAAEGMGSRYKGRHLGTMAKLSAISFNGNKIMTTGGGGMILTQDKSLAERAKHLTTQAKIPHRWDYAHDEIGYNFRMPNLNAAMGVAQLEQLPSFLENKRQTAMAYKAHFANMEVNFYDERAEEKCNFWLNAIILNDRKERDSFLEYSNDREVMTRPIWTLMNKMPMFAHCQHDGLQNSQWLEDRVVNIPSSVIQ